MLNKVMLIGRLGADPQLHYGGGSAGSGSAICRLSVATSDSYTDRDGNRVERTEWHNVVAFQRTAENCANFLAKGSLVYVEGSLQTRKWEDKEGQTRYTTEIRAQRVLFLDRKGDGQRGGASWNAEGMNSQPGNYGGRNENRNANYGNSGEYGNPNDSRGRPQNNRRQADESRNNTDFPPAGDMGDNVGFASGGSETIDEVPF